MENMVQIEVSARHVHLKKEDIKTLFGKDELTWVKDISQPGQFASAERLTVVGPKRSIQNVIVLGPARPKTQVEVSLTDARSLGISVPIRESGDVAGSGACKLIGPCGEVELSEGVIAIRRHIHFTPEVAEKIGVSDGDSLSVKIDNGERQTVYGDVSARVSPKFAYYMHIDTDEANAACVSGVCFGEIVK